MTIKVLSAKYMSNQCSVCPSCKDELEESGLSLNNKKDIGIVYTCPCGKSKVWTNRARNDARLLFFLEKKPHPVYGMSPYTIGFCNDMHDGFKFDDITILKGGVEGTVDETGENPADLIGNDHVQILHWRGKELQVGQEDQILEIYRRRLPELKALVEGFSSKTTASSDSFRYWNNCTSTDDELVDWIRGRATNIGGPKADEIDFDEFTAQVDPSELQHEDIDTDWHVHFFESTLPSGEPIVYYTHSGIEWFFAMGHVDQDKELAIISKLNDEKYGVSASASSEFNSWFRNSKVVKADGSPAVVYHGTNSAFSEFDAEKGSGFFGTGVYVTEDQNEAEKYGEHLLELYARAENPIDLRGDNKDFDRELAKIGIEAPYEKLRTAKEFRDRAVKLRADLMAKGYDSARITTSDGADGWVLYSADQVKLVTNTHPTESTKIGASQDKAGEGRWSNRQVTDVWYHGGSKEDAASAKKLGHFPEEYTPLRANWGSGVYLTADKKEAKKFGDSVVEVELSSSLKMLDIRDKNYRAMPSTISEHLKSEEAVSLFEKHWPHDLGTGVKAALIADGYDGIVWKGDEWHDWAVVFNPTQAKIRQSKTVKAGWEEGGHHLLVAFTTPPTDEVFAALDQTDKVREKLYAHRDLPKVPRGVRLDLPSMAKGIAVVTVHAGPSGGTVIGYDHSAVIKDVRFVVQAGAQKAIGAEGSNKFPMSFIAGVLQDVPAEPKGTPVYYDPRKVHLYVDATNMRPVRTAHLVNMIGKQVYATGLEYYTADNVPPAPDGMSSAVLMPTVETEAVSAMASPYDKGWTDLPPGNVPVPTPLKDKPTLWAKVADRLGHEVDKGLQQRAPVIGGRRRHNRPMTSWLMSDGRVLSFTTEKLEAKTWNNLKGKTHPALPHVYDVFSIGGDGEEPMWAIVHEQLIWPVPPEWESFVDNFFRWRALEKNALHPATPQDLEDFLRFVIDPEVTDAKTVKKKQVENALPWGMAKSRRVDFTDRRKEVFKLKGLEEMIAWAKEALSYLKQNNVKFRDLDPSNLAVTKHGDRVVVTNLAESNSIPTKTGRTGRVKASDDGNGHGPIQPVLDLSLILC